MTAPVSGPGELAATVEASPYGGHCGRQMQCPAKCGCGEEVKGETKGDGK
jgi:hypothetical protein